MMPADAALLRAVAIDLDSPSAADPLPTADLTTLEHARSHRVQGLLAAAVSRGVVLADAPTVEAIYDAHLAALRTCLVAEETAVLAFDALWFAGVECRVLKGVAVAHLDHDDPAERVFGDADVLVGRADHGRALAVLAAAGFVRDEPPVRGWWERRFGKAIVLQAPNGGELDLHLTITGGYFGERIDGAALLARNSEPVVLAGRTVGALDREDRLLQACCHSVLGGGSGLRAQRDIAQLLLLRNADWQVAVDRAEPLGVDVVLALGVQRAWSSLGLAVDHPAAVWANAFAASEQQIRALGSYDAAFSSTWGPEGRSILAALGPLDRARFVAGLAFPSRASLRARGRTWRQHVRQGSSTMRSSQ
jgi:Uncharacterised nucleotidyltransferase